MNTAALAQELAEASGAHFVSVRWDAPREDLRVCIVARPGRALAPELADLLTRFCFLAGRALLPVGIHGSSRILGARFHCPPSTPEPTGETGAAPA